jgi:arylsulfatase A-like enzyme
VPSHASFFTGLMPRALGMREVPSPAAAKALLETQRSRFLPELLRARGYETVGVSANPWASELSGFGSGFDSFTLVKTERRAHADWDSLRGRGRWLAETARGRFDDGARSAQKALAGRLCDHRERPFFCFVNLVEAHFPYLPPRPYGGLSTLGRLRAANDARRYFTLDAIYRANGGALEVPAQTLEQARRLYRGAVRYLDDWLAGLLERLDASGTLEDTLLIVTSDHGENFGEGGLIAHMLSVDQRLIHVPFVVAGPLADRIELNSLADLPRRLAEALDIDEHPWHDGPPAGIGVAQSDGLGDPSDPRLIQALDEAGIVDETLRSRFTSPLSCAVRGGLKLVRRGDSEELYDLSADPLELEPLPVHALGDARAAEIATLRAALDHPAMAAAAPLDTPVPEDDDHVSSEEIGDLEDRMRLLGYL